MGRCRRWTPPRRVGQQGDWPLRENMRAIPNETKRETREMTIHVEDEGDWDACFLAGNRKTRWNE